MQVIKRNGTTSPFDFEKIRKVVEFATQNTKDAETFLADLQIQLKNNITTRELHKVVTQLAVEKVSAQDTKWDSTASRLYNYNLIKEASLNRGYDGFGYGDFYELLTMLTDAGLYHEDILKSYTKSDVKTLGKYIVPERDNLLTYAGVKALAERYLVRSHDGKVLELPQESYMGVAMFLALAEKPEERVYWSKKFYDTLSKLEMTVATPTMSNARKPHNQLSSCFINTVEDSLESIYNVVDIFSQVSKYGGGEGIYIGKVRAQNSDIRGFKNASDGVIPWIRLINDTAVAVNQLGVRAGAVSVTLDIWHRDMPEFLQLKTNNGDERRKAHDIFPAVSIPDLFMKQLREKGNWYLFCPHEIRTAMGWSLEDSWGEEFEERYWKCVNNPELSKIEVKAMDIFKQIIKSTTETGTPFLFFRDTVNRMNPNKHAGMIYSSNLCVEIAQNMKANGEVTRRTVIDENGDTIIVESRKAGDMVVCNLSSLNLGRINKKEDIYRVVPLAIRMMDNVIDLNFYPVEQARNTNKKYRAVGLGTFGYHHMLAQNYIQWESEEHLTFVDEIYSYINYAAIEASMNLAKERGVYPMFEGSDWQTGEYFNLREYSVREPGAWDWLIEQVKENGIRNGYIMAVAPNGTSSLYGGSTQSIDPVYDRFYLDEKKGSVTPIFAPDLTDLYWFYKEAHTVDQTWSIRANAVRQRHIDQSQSFNYYITPETSAGTIAKYYMLAWELGVKTMYYCRSRSVEVENCESCSA